MFFRDIVDQKRIIKLLQGIAQHGRIANGYLFTGPPGSRQKDTALAFARFVNCHHPGAEDACGQCRACYKFSQAVFPDLIVVTPTGTKLKKEQIKALGKQTKYGPYEGKWLFVIIEQADTMTTEAANSFLKLLEEPAERTTFILSTFNENALLATIISRCQKIGFDYVEPPAVLTEYAKLADLDFIAFSRLAEELAKDKKNAKNFLDMLLKDYQDQQEFSKIGIVLACLRKLNYNVNVRLCLEAMFLKIKEKEQ
jgi:DNA polymerase III subunit delta'